MALSDGSMKCFGVHDLWPWIGMVKARHELRGGGRQAGGEIIPPGAHGLVRRAASIRQKQVSLRKMIYVCVRYLEQI